MLKPTNHIARNAYHDQQITAKCFAKTSVTWIFWASSGWSKWSCWSGSPTYLPKNHLLLGWQNRNSARRWSKRGTKIIGRIPVNPNIRTTEDEQNIIKRFPSVFRDSLGQWTKMKANLYLKKMRNHFSIWGVHFPSLLHKAYRKSRHVLIESAPYNQYHTVNGPRQ